MSHCESSCRAASILEISFLNCVCSGLSGPDSPRVPSALTTLLRPGSTPPGDEGRFINNSSGLARVKRSFAKSANATMPQQKRRCSARITPQSPNACDRGRALAVICWDLLVRSDGGFYGDFQLAFRQRPRAYGILNYGSRHT